MPPKFRFTRDEIISAAANVTRRLGPGGLTARALADELGCSVKPIFEQFGSMEEVQDAVLTTAHSLYESYLAEDMAAGKYPPYKASGMAYIRFATEEKGLFRLLFMRDRSGEAVTDDRDEIRPLLKLIERDLGIDEDSAYIFHLELWIVVHGIATMIATSYLTWDEAFVSRVLTDTYMGLKTRFRGLGEEDNGSRQNG